MPAPKAFGMVGVLEEEEEEEEEGEEGREREEELELVFSPSSPLLLPAMTPNSTTNQ